MVTITTMITATTLIITITASNNAIIYWSISLSGLSCTLMNKVLVSVFSNTQINDYINNISTSDIHENTVSISNTQIIVDTLHTSTRQYSD